MERFWKTGTLAPTVLIFSALTVLPIFNILFLSFHRVEWESGKSVWTFVEFLNYSRLLRDSVFHAGILNTIIFAICTVSAQILIGFALALLVSSIHRARVLFRAIFILPILVPGIVIGAVWKLMYSTEFGVINQISHVIGLPTIDWLGNPNLALLSVIIVDVWHWTPFCFLLLLAGLESMPQDVYEAAKVDGVSKFQELRYITLPLMIPTIVVTFIFRLIISFKVFDEIFLLTAGGPGTATEVVSFTIYRTFFTESQEGYGAAMSIATISTMALAVIMALAVKQRRSLLQ